ncbi:MAG: hypothetical protein J5654_12935 [Victivallales bacterium]|nr:hypothetical protein [Victivallales bacterium]
MSGHWTATIGHQASGLQASRPSGLQDLRHLSLRRQAVGRQGVSRDAASARSVRPCVTGCKCLKGTQLPDSRPHTTSARKGRDNSSGRLLPQSVSPHRPSKA